MASVFGYGSLVNLATHRFSDPRPARLRGYRRSWTHAEARAVSFLSVTVDPDCEIAGLLTRVPDHEWAELDQREADYRRRDLFEHELLRAEPDHPLEDTPTRLYEAPVQHDRAAPPILLSYLDVVIQGFAQQLGAQSVPAFFATTGGWDRPILNDRDAPLYPRAQNLSAAEVALVDDALAELSANIVEAPPR